MKNRSQQTKCVLLPSSYCTVSMVLMLLRGTWLWTCEIGCLNASDYTILQLLASPWLKMNVRWKCLCLTVGFFQVLFCRVMRNTSKPCFHCWSPTDTRNSHSMSQLQNISGALNFGGFFSFRDGNKTRARLPQRVFLVVILVSAPQNPSNCSSNPVPMPVSKVKNTWLDHQVCLYSVPVQNRVVLPEQSPLKPWQLAKSNPPRKPAKRGQPNNSVQIEANLLLVTFLSCSKHIQVHTLIKACAKAGFTEFHTQWGQQMVDLKQPPAIRNKAEHVFNSKVLNSYEQSSTLLNLFWHYVWFYAVFEGYQHCKGSLLGLLTAQIGYFLKYTRKKGTRMLLGQWKF